MARKPRPHPTGDPNTPPVEINMTDLEAQSGGRRPHGDSHAAGTPGGGSAVGGLAGTNVDDGDPDNADLEDAMGSGVHDTDDEAADDDQAPGTGRQPPLRSNP